MAYEGPQGGDIRATLALSQAEAQAGSSRTVTLPGGRRLTVPVRAGIRDGEEIRLKGQGEPTWVGGPVGDLVLTVSIAAPSGQYYSQPGFVNEPASPTDYMQAPSSLPTPPTPSYPMPNPTPISNPNYNQVGPYGSSSSPNYPPTGSALSLPKSRGIRGFSTIHGVSTGRPAVSAATLTPATTKEARALNNCYNPADRHRSLHSCRQRVHLL